MRRRRRRRTKKLARGEGDKHRRAFEEAATGKYVDGKLRIEDGSSGRKRLVTVEVEEGVHEAIIKLRAERNPAQDASHSTQT